MHTLCRNEIHAHTHTQHTALCACACVWCRWAEGGEGCECGCSSVNVCVCPGKTHVTHNDHDDDDRHHCHHPTYTHAHTHTHICLHHVSYIRTQTHTHTPRVAYSFCAVATALFACRRVGSAFGSARFERTVSFFDLFASAPARERNVCVWSVLYYIFYALALYIPFSSLARVRRQPKKKNKNAGLRPHPKRTAKTHKRNKPTHPHTHKNPTLSNSPERRSACAISVGFHFIL